MDFSVVHLHPWFGMSATHLVFGYITLVLLAAVIVTAVVLFGRRQNPNHVPRRPEPISGKYPAVMGVAIAMVILVSVGLLERSTRDAENHTTTDADVQSYTVVPTPGELAAEPTTQSVPTATLEPTLVAVASEAADQIADAAQGGSGASVRADDSSLNMPNDIFRAIVERTDKPVADGTARRGWVWGPNSITPPITEVYMGSPDNVRLVQYFDRGRLEITYPGKAPEAAWRATSGLLTLELVTGRIQIGPGQYDDRGPADIPIFTNINDAEFPTYADFNSLLDAEPLPVESTITQRLQANGTISIVPTLGLRQIDIAYTDPVLQHSIARPFWTFMNREDTIWNDGAYIDDRLFEDPFFATGHPITEPYWISTTSNGASKDVLVQCFERRCLTYAPANAAQWRVESVMVGRHYFEWRYGVDLQ